MSSVSFCWCSALCSTYNLFRCCDERCVLCARSAWVMILYATVTESAAYVFLKYHSPLPFSDFRSRFSRKLSQCPCTSRPHVPHRPCRPETFLWGWSRVGVRVRRSWSWRRKHGQGFGSWWCVVLCLRSRHMCLVPYKHGLVCYWFSGVHTDRGHVDMETSLPGDYTSGRPSR